MTDLAEAARALRERSREAQGLPPVVADPVALARLAALLGESESARPRSLREPAA